MYYWQATLAIGRLAIDFSNDCAYEFVMHNDIGTDDQSCYQYFIKDLETNTLISGFWDQDFDTWSRNSDHDHGLKITSLPMIY